MAAVHAAATPRPERKGLDAPVVWARPSGTPLPLGELACAEDTSHMEVAEIRADYNWLYVDLAYHKAGLAAPGDPPVAPDIEMLAEGCPVTAPNASGAVARDGASPSTMTIGLSNLPDGEIDLFFSAFGSRAQAPIRKSGRNVTYLTRQQRARYRFIPGDPKRWMGPASTIDDPVCPDGRLQ